MTFSTSNKRLPFSILRKLGIYVDEHFLSPELCLKMLSTLSLCECSQAPVKKGGTNYINKKTRKTLLLNPPESCHEIISQKHSLLQPKLERFFDINIMGQETSQYLRYRSGDYFIPHADESSAHASSNSYLRKISIICYLNTQVEDIASTIGNFQEGELVLYGLLDDQKSKTSGFPISATAGLLIAFKSDLLHEVCPITAGERYSIVSWFY